MMDEKKIRSSRRREEKIKKRRRALAAPFFTVLFALAIVAAYKACIETGKNAA